MGTDGDDALEADDMTPVSPEKRQQAQETGVPEGSSALPPDLANGQTLDVLTIETVNSDGNMLREEEGGMASSSIESADDFPSEDAMPSETAQSPPDASSIADPSLAELEEELFPLSDEDDVLARGGFLPETSSNRQGG